MARDRVQAGTQSGSQAHALGYCPTLPAEMGPNLPLFFMHMFFFIVVAFTLYLFLIEV